MRVNLDWLRDWVELDGNVESIAADLTTAGLEVDAVQVQRPVFLDRSTHPWANVKILPP